MRAAAEAAEIGLAQAHLDMRILLVIVPAQHLAMGIKPGERRAVAQAARRAARDAGRRRAAGRAGPRAASHPSPVAAEIGTASRLRCAWLASALRCSSVSRSILLSASMSPCSTVSPRPELVEHGVHIVALRLALGMMDVADMDDEIGLGHLFQRGAEGGDEMRRQVGDEADRVGQDRRAGPRAAAAAAWSGRASRTAGPPATTSARVRRLNRVDLPALV